MLEALLGAGLFTALILGLVLLILFARAKLLPTGDVDVLLGPDRTLRLPLGSTLLDAMTSAGVPLPAACGGKGTCGFCRVRVLRGGGEPLPVERDKLSRGELTRGVRLACQVRLREELEVELPPELKSVRKIECTVRSARCVSTFIKEVVLELPPDRALEFRAGAFVQITCPVYRLRYSDLAIDEPYRAEWDRLDLRRYEASASVPTTRAYSLANAPHERGFLMLDVRIATPPPAVPDAPPGVVSSWIFGLRPGDRVEVAGPFGDFHASDTDREMILVGGGVGMAPLRSIILDELARGRPERRIGFWYGARSRSELLYADELRRLQAEHPRFRYVAALSEPKPEDAWDGPVGFIHAVLFEGYLRQHPSVEECEFYLCGPPLMILATRKMLDDLGVDPENVHFDDFGG